MFKASKDPQVMNIAKLFIVSLKVQFEEASRVNEVTSQLTQQTEYCAGMGAACATLLWRVSRRDDAVESLLSGVSLYFCYITHTQIPSWSVYALSRSFRTSLFNFLTEMQAATFEMTPCN